MDIAMLRNKANDLPLKPGVYMMKNEEGHIIYVGKAKALKNRVTSYFRNTSGHTLKVAAMVRNVRDFEVIITDTEFEALVLENNLIKQYTPKYNILLRDDKGYPYIRVDKGIYPDYRVVPKPSEDGADYYGPYNGRTVAFEVINTLRSALGIPSCKKKFPRDIGKTRPCINREIGKCVGLCTGDVSEEEFSGITAEARMLLRGESEALEADIRKRMEAAAEELDFERAAKLRDKLRAVEKLRQKQKVSDAIVSDIDVIFAFAGEARGCIAVLRYLGGNLSGKSVEIIDGSLEQEDIPGVLEEFISQFYRQDVRIPPEIALSHDIPSDELYERWFSERAGKRVRIINPKRGEKKKLLDMAYENAADEARRATDREERVSAVLELLKNTASLKRLPARIEAYDISNTAGAENVGAMIVCENGKLRKGHYRTFKIKTIDGQDDYGSMREMLTRRFSELSGNDESFKRMPSLILMDGGIGHVSTALEVLRELQIDCEVLGMVKDDHHRTRALVRSDGGEMGLETKPALFRFIGTIQEEVHRFAIKYHSRLRMKKQTGSSLDTIPNIGPERRKTLLREFRTIERIKAASLEELARVIPKNAAKSVYDRFHQE
ncbi:MAG: excinuclease ABC subunit UvrC [Clostridiales bacterium]|nr:excinuclease ABC subunit UvrC [Clostridiales bacterium]